ncbi:MAG: head completion/stabilization protein [Proteobacteria bacterium]|nr:head completion/stabilization protein [Pseudomonadota bacterium]
MSFTGFSDDIDPAAKVENAPFWPDLILSQFQAVYRLPAEYRVELLEERLKIAMVWANRQLTGWRMEKELAGAATLEAVPVDPNDMLGTDHPLVLLYTRAVSCHAKALLLPDYATMMRKSDAQSDAKESEDTADKWYQFAADALNDLQGKPKIHAELL